MDSSTRTPRDRGATLVEYALGVSLVVVASIASIQFMTDSSGDEFNDRADQAGAPDLEEVTDGGGTGGDTSGGDTGGSDDPVPVDTASFGGFTGAGSKNGAKGTWRAEISVIVNDADGQPLEGVQVDGSWTYLDGSTSKTVTAVCNQTNNKGECKFQLSDLPANVTDVTFTMTDISGGVPEVTYDGGSQTAPAITKP